MSIIKNSIDLGSGFNIKSQGPIDSRMVVETIEDLTTVWNSDSPAYEGMVVSVLEDGNVYILKNMLSSNSGSDSESDESVSIETIYSDIRNWKKIGSDSSVNGSGIGKYSLPVMTEEMKGDALADPDSGFTNESSYISIDDGSSLNGETTSNTITAVNGSYLYIMMNTIRALQAEITKLKNTFQYGIHSYNNEVTAMSSVMDQYDDTLMDEPLWALDPYMMSEVFDTANFKTDLVPDNFTISGFGGHHIDASIPEQLTFVDGKGEFSDKANTLLNLTDSKLVTYLVTSKKDVIFNLHTKDNTGEDGNRCVNIATFIGDNVDHGKYGIMLVLSRKSEIGGVLHGKNYIYISVINYDTNEKIVEGYLTSGDTISKTLGGNTTSYRYSIKSIEFEKLTLYRMKFYTKYEDFSEEVIPSAPDDNNTYKAAHLTIRSVKNSAMIERIKEQLHENELIWNEDSKELNIKSKNKIYRIGIVGSNDNNTNTDETMTPKELIEKLAQMGIIVNAEFKDDEISNINDLKLNDISAFTLINSDTDKKYTFTVDPHGKLIGKDESMKTIEMDLAKIFGGNNFDEKVNEMNKFLDVKDGDGKTYGWVRGFISKYLKTLKGDRNTWIPNSLEDYGLTSDRLRISSFYAPLKTDKVHGCTHSFIELENTSDVDIPLEGIYLHFYIPPIKGDGDSITEGSDKVYHLALDGIIKSGSTYLIRGAQHAEMDDVSAFIKVDSYDKEWYYKKTKKDDNGNDILESRLISFEQEVVATINDKGNNVDETNNRVGGAYKFCLTYGMPNLEKDDVLIIQNNNSIKINQYGEIVNNTTETSNDYSKSNYPNIIKNRRYIDGCGFSRFAGFAAPAIYDGKWFCGGVTIKENTMFRNMFALDPAKQAYNGWNKTDSSRTRYNSANDLQVVSLAKEYIGFPHSCEIVPISRYTPKASYENRNVMTDKTQLDREKPNMVTCSFGIDVYKTRCFNWISCGAFDEYLWVRKKEEDVWKKFESYTKVSTKNTQKEFNDSVNIIRKEFDVDVNNAVYARITNRFPGNNVLFTAHKVIIEWSESVNEPVVYEYVVGRADKDGNPDPNHTNEIYTFTLYPSSYEGRTYQITDQQGFHWIEYQVWAATAEKLNDVIKEECNKINSGNGVKVFPILINTGDMTQSGARINEWLDYYNGGKCLFNHMEQMNCVGNNDLCDIDPTVLGTGDDVGKSNAKFFHYFYCYEVPNDYSLIVKKHSVNIKKDEISSETPLTISEDRYIPSIYYFETKGVMYIVANSEITKTTCEKWFGLYGSPDSNGITYPINLYTGIEIRENGNYNKTCQEIVSESESDIVFHPIYETIYSWMDGNTEKKKVVFACHEIPFTVITKKSLSNNNESILTNTRNYPDGSALLGSHMNQLDKTENRGTYWLSRLLEQFGCKLCIGGHKHTYALSYPIKEKYKWCERGEANYTNSLEDTVPMGETLEDEAGINPKYDISWFFEDGDKYDGNDKSGDSDGYTNQYKIAEGVSLKINSTKLPYIPSDLYEAIGKNTFDRSSDLYRCCTPVDVGDNKKYTGFVNYSMCQATGYKLKSNKELPSAYQVFSKLIPETEIKDGSDKANGNQLYPMFSVLEFEHGSYVEDDNSYVYYVNGINVKMCRVTGIFKENGKDSFTQTSYGKDVDLSIQCLIGGNKDNFETINTVLTEMGYGEKEKLSKATCMYGVWIPNDKVITKDGEVISRYLYIKY